MSPIEGFGNAGSIAAELFEQAGVHYCRQRLPGGHRCRGRSGCACRVEHKAAKKTVVGSPGTKTITNTESLTLDSADILIPAALECQIRADNAGQVRTRFVVEAANGPTTPSADQILFAKSIPVLPDILVNSGGVTVSYFEWVQNIENEKWDEAEVNEKLRHKMEQATDAVIDRQEAVNGENGVSRPPVDLRTAALIVAIDRVANVALERGIWP